MHKLISSILFASVAFVSLSAETCGDTHYISDSGFDLWCGTTLCNWEVHSGSVLRAPTWHKGDYSVELFGSDVLISQLSTRDSTSCLRFEMLADIEENARVTLSIDFYDDGVIDYSQEIGRVRWEPLVYLISAPPSWEGVRFYLHKEGAGRARLAQIEALKGSTCIDKPIELPGKPLGAHCFNNEGECEGGYCLPSVTNPAKRSCSACEVDADCPDGEACGASSDMAYFLSPSRACLPEASRGLGALCVGDAECGTGVCCAGTCSECCSGVDCEDGSACQRSSLGAVGSALMPALCSSKRSESLCSIDSDCASGSCKGTGVVRICSSDGRDCEVDQDCNLADCPWEGDYCLGNSEAPPASCETIGIASGTCQ